MQRIQRCQSRGKVWKKLAIISKQPYILSFELNDIGWYWCFLDCFHFAQQGKGSIGCYSVAKVVDSRDHKGAFCLLCSEICFFKASEYSVESLKVFFLSRSCYQNIINVNYHAGSALKQTLDDMLEDTQS